MLKECFEKLKNNKNFDAFLEQFLTSIFLDEIDTSDIQKYKLSILEYFFLNKTEFLYYLKYKTFKLMNSKYLEQIFDMFTTNNEEWVELFLKECGDSKNGYKVLAILGNKKVEILKTLTLYPFKSLENDIKNSEIVTNMLNSIVEHLQTIQKNQNIMLANISHEMRTPLNSVIGYLDILEYSKYLSLEDRKYVNYAKNSSKLLLTLINDLLDTQKLSSATLDLTNNPFWINKVIKAAILISSVNAHQKNIKIEFIDNTEIFSEVTGDKNRFLQILNNLFSNAIKFTPKNGKVKINVYSEDLDDSVKLYLSVQDTGIGIPTDKQKDLFKPFKRATNKERGTGLGLYISKQLAQKMGGDIWFESEEGKGSTFYLELLFKKSNHEYHKETLQNKKVVLLQNKKNDVYCKNLLEQLNDLEVEVKTFINQEEFMKYLIFKQDIDIAIISYPNKIEKENIDISFIKTYKNISKQETFFIAAVDDNYYLEDNKIFNKVINKPVSLLDIIEVVSSKKEDISNYRYLIIDDEPMNRLVLKEMIKKLDTTAIIDIAEDGIEGLKKIQNSKYDIVFLDKRMPKMDGYEVLEKVKELNIKTNIYLLTADGDNETINKTKEYNVGYIAKPITLATLKSILGFIPKDENDSNI